MRHHLRMPAGRDLSAETFIVLRRALFDPAGFPLPFKLRDKRNTQDDPLDEYLQAVVAEAQVSEHVACSDRPALSSPRTWP